MENAEKSGLALAALALITARIAADLQDQRISGDIAHAIFSDARALVRDRAGFVVDPEIAGAADEFLSIAEALTQPDARRTANEN